MLYLRAFNLEKGKELKKARDIYVELVTRNADSPHLNEALFKIAAISAFGLRDLDTGREYFTKLAQKDKADPETVSALYYLGLLSQWKEDLAEAKKYYDKAMLVAADNYKDTIELVRQRLGEIGNNRPIEYNLKTFLDASLRPENSRFNMTKVGLQALPLSPKAADAVEITSTAASDSGGCMQVAMDYYWSGNTGSAKPSLTTSGFNTTYALPGTKALFLVVFAASEIVDRDFCLVDVR
jgi:tetratricopeptide (TPR) repeat protein